MEPVVRWVSLFRAVGSDELQDLSASQTFRTVPGSLEAKLFWTTRRDAERFARLLAARFGIRPTWVVEALVEPAALGRLQLLPMDGRPVRVVAKEDLDWFNGVVVDLVIPNEDADGPAHG